MVRLVTERVEDYWRSRGNWIHQADTSDALEAEDDLFKGLGLGGRRSNDVALVDTDFQQTAVLMELGEYRKVETVRTTREKSALFLQAVVRGWLARQRFLSHKAQLAELMANLKCVRETEAATVCQTLARRYLAKQELHRLQQDADRRREEDAKRKKKGKKGKVPVLPDEMPRSQRLVIMNEAFLAGWDHWRAAMSPEMNKVLHYTKLDDAIRVWDKIKGNQDKVLQRMIEIAHRYRDAGKTR